MWALQFDKYKLPNRRSELGKIPDHLVFHGLYRTTSFVNDLFGTITRRWPYIIP